MNIDVTIEKIQIVEGENCFVLFNLLSGAVFKLDKDIGLTLFRDTFGNATQNDFDKIKINEEVFYLTEKGQNIHLHDGTTIALLSTQDIRELAEQTFYEVGQTRIYDFINQKFTVEF